MTIVDLSDSYEANQAGGNMSVWAKSRIFQYVQRGWLFGETVHRIPYVQMKQVGETFEVTGESGTIYRIPTTITFYRM